MKKSKIIPVLFFAMYMVLAMCMSVYAADTDSTTTSILGIIESYIPVLMLEALGVVMALIFFDALLGACVAWKKGTLSLSKLPQFVSSNLWPYIGGLLVLAAISIIYNAWLPAFYTVAALVSGKFLLADIKDKAVALFGSDAINTTSDTATEAIDTIEEIKTAITGVTTEVKELIAAIVPGDSGATSSTTAAASAISIADAVTAISNFTTAFATLQSLMTPITSAAAASTDTAAAATTTPQTVSG